MPAFNLRLTDSQHEQIRDWTHERGPGWSMQREIIRRLFGDTVLGEPEAPTDAAAEHQGPSPSGSPSAADGHGAQRDAATTRGRRGDETPVPALAEPGGPSASGRTRTSRKPTLSPPATETCGLASRHHMNSRIKPCPRCGYPKEAV